MSKRPTRPKIVTDDFYQESGLPTQDQVNRIVADTTGQPIVKAPTSPPGKRTFAAADLEARKYKPRSPETAQGRVKLTTMMHPELREKLDTIAKARGLTIADVLEIIVTEYLADLKRPK